MRRAIGLLFVAALAFVGGCGPANQPLGGSPRKKIYKSVVSLSPSTTEVLSTTQQTSILRGKTASDNWPRIMFDKVPVVASVKPDYEKISGISPDLILYDKDLFTNESDIAKIKQLGADTFVLDATTIDSFIKELYALSSLVGGETYVSDYVDRIYLAKAGAATMTRHPKVAVLMPGLSGDHMIAGQDSFVADVVRAAGGVPVGPKSSLYVKLDPEFLVTENPDFIISVGKGDALLADPRIKSVKAITDKKVVPVMADVILRRGARVDLLITAIYDNIAK